jgi:hypothetical protein
MAEIKNLIRELKLEIFKNVLLTTFLKSAVLFFIVDIIKSFMDFSWVISYIFAGAYFVTAFIRRMKEVNLKIFERHNPEIKEMLTTAADNVNLKNQVALELFNEVIQKARKLSSGTIIIPGIILLMVLSLPILAIIDYELNPIRIDQLSQDSLLGGIERITKISGFFNTKKNIDGEIIDDGLLDQDIYGERRIATLGSEEINLRMNLGFETDLTRPSEEDLKQSEFTDYPEDYNEELVDDPFEFRENIAESDLAIKYNEKIRNLR